MDTALITFMLQTSTPTQSVHLIGSWDNFTKHYPMERDIKRSRGQWRGCYTFEDIICDGDGRNDSKRTGGLKMGSTYYYYYELDNGTEFYDASIPFTTSCPYLPGQPVNLLYVPIEVQPLRFRSASMTSMANGHVKTMNPLDKFMSPRQAPPTPLLPRLNTSPSPYPPRRTARSLSPKVDKQWSPRSLFGLRSPLPTDQDGRGRSSSLSKMSERGTNNSSSSISTRREDRSKSRPSPTSRSPSPPSSIKRINSREPSPLRQVVAQENLGYTTTTFIVPDEIVEEAEDDENFASDYHRGSVHERGLYTQLSPPPSARTQALVRSLTDTSKPLPQLPPLKEESLAFSGLSSMTSDSDSHSVPVPDPLRLRPSYNEPRSHFSVSTIASSNGSPSDSSFCFSDTSISEDEEEDLTADLESGDDSVNSPLNDTSPVLESKSGFAGYSLPGEEYASQHTLTKVASPLSPLSAAATRTTFGAAAFTPVTDMGSDEENMSALELLMSEMGYLGDVIINK